MARMTRVIDILKNGARVLAILYLFPLIMGTLGVTFLGLVVLFAKVLGADADHSLVASQPAGAPR